MKRFLPLLLLLALCLSRTIHYHDHLFMRWEFAFAQGVGFSVLAFFLSYGAYLLIINPVMRRVRFN